MAALIFLGTVSLSGQLRAHSPSPAEQSKVPSPSSSASPVKKSQPSSTATRLTIEVTAGENNDPVDSASVYVKFIQEHKLRKDKRFEMNVKTNRDGIAHVPEPPKGKILIQVIAPGWKPFGKWFEIEDLSQPVQIHLEKPKQWY